jgi:hypothetical protein
MELGGKLTERATGELNERAGELQKKLFFRGKKERENTLGLLEEMRREKGRREKRRKGTEEREKRKNRIGMEGQPLVTVTSKKAGQWWK